MAGHISYPRAAAIAHAWRDYRHAVALFNMGATDLAITNLRNILSDPNASMGLKAQAAALLFRLYEERDTLEGLSPQILVPGGGLLAHGGYAVGHTLSMHVVLPEENLSDVDEFLKGRNLNFASVFADRETAEIATKSNIEANKDIVQQWLDGNQDRCPPLVHHNNAIIGFGFERGKTCYELISKTRTILIRDKNRIEGYYILTSYPVPEKKK